MTKAENLSCLLNSETILPTSFGILKASFMDFKRTNFQTWLVQDKPTLQKIQARIFFVDFKLSHFDTWLPWVFSKCFILLQLKCCCCRFWSFHLNWSKHVSLKASAKTFRFWGSIRWKNFYFSFVMRARFFIFSPLMTAKTFPLWRILYFHFPWIWVHIDIFSRAYMDMIFWWHVVPPSP